MLICDADNKELIINLKAIYERNKCDKISVSRSFFPQVWRHNGIKEGNKKKSKLTRSLQLNKNSLLFFSMLIYDVHIVLKPNLGSM